MSNNRKASSNNVTISKAMIRPHRSVALLDIAVILANLHKANEDNEIGFEDALRSIEEVSRYLNKFAQVDSAVLESALWSCTLLSEKGKFWHPFGTRYEDFIKKIEQRFGGDKFNMQYNFIKDN